MQFNRQTVMRRMAIALLVCWSAQLRAAEWLTDLPQALARAKTENKLVLMDFTGSDWCPGCILLHDTVFSSKAFQAYADKNLVLVLVDFPDKIKQSKELEKANVALAKEFKVDGYPTVILLDPNRKELKTISGYSGEKPDEYVAELGIKGR
jgi:thioredoxin-related protein